MQVFNPFLPLNEYIPDGEPHIFDGRVYLFGSHDKEGGYTFCMEDYVTYSASVDDLTTWKYEGVIYKASQDPLYPKFKYMYAPDVVKGNDGKYYLYYSMSGDYGIGGYTNPISVAVSNKPYGPYEFLGYVKNKDGSIMKKYVCFDPALLNDNGVIRLYYGTQYDFEERDDFKTNDKYLKQEMEMFGKTKEEILSYPDSVMGPVMLILEDDMLTVKEEAKHIIDYKVKNTSFENHPFFEASSMRRVNDKYYFIYSSKQNHELCYAISNYPDKEFTFGGTIVSNGDIGLNGRKEDDKLNMTGTTHGSIIEINNKWYVFYHRLTHKSDYSRQACAERIYINKDGSIDQVEITSCGLNDGPLIAKGVYPAVIACNITNGRMPHGCNSIYKEEFPNVTNRGDERFIGEIENDTLIGFKYFKLECAKSISVIGRFETKNNKAIFNNPERIDVRTKRVEEIDYSSLDELCYFSVMISDDIELGKIILSSSDDEFKWVKETISLCNLSGVYPIYLKYHGKYKYQLKEIVFE